MRWNVPFAERGWKAPLQPLLDQARAVIVFGNHGVELWDSEGRTAFHEGLAALRLGRLARGDRTDPLVRAADFQPGDIVLDATLGLGQDAMVAARAVGPSGRVLGVERSAALHALVAAGLESRRPDPGSGRIETRCADSAEVLASLPPRAVDVVLFDPMFGRSQGAQPPFQMLRRHASHAPLTPELLALGRRVARRVVVVKASRYPDILKGLGLTPEPRSRLTQVVYARASPHP
ncbi:MAG TPA: class I SAM-dependent methyltransferase [Myxococcaceae bacterium]